MDRFAQDNLPPRELWPELIFTRPELQYPARLNCVSALLDDIAARHGADRPCLFGARRNYTYGELQAQVNRIANALVNRCGLLPGQRVLLRAANNPMMAASYLAVLKAGGIVVATMPLLRARELVYQIQKARIALALCDAALLDEMVAAQAEAPDLARIVAFNTAAPDGLDAMAEAESAAFAAYDSAAEDICLIAFTSGTTGVPKGTMHNHRDILAICDGYARNLLRAGPDDRFIGSPPLAFTFGLGGMLLFPLHAGASTVLLERAGPDDLLPAIARHRATICFTAPTAYRAMLAKLPGHDISSLRRCVSAGEALPAPTFAAWQVATGITITEGIGSTEMLHIFIGSDPETARPGCTGKPVPGYEAKVIDDSGVEVPDGVVGRLAVRGPTGCRYLADERQRVYVQNGWNVTGDTYMRDADGYFAYQARSDDMIVSAGYNIAGPEVESVMLMHPAVAECAVVGAADAERGAIVKAFVVLAQGHVGDAALTKQLQDHAKAVIAPYKYPRAIDYVSALPRTETGKLQRFRLRG
jgi:2-aminobenzoate-CoA ligase